MQNRQCSSIDFAKVRTFVHTARTMECYFANLRLFNRMPLRHTINKGYLCLVKVDATYKNKAPQYQSNTSARGITMQSFGNHYVCAIGSDPKRVTEVRV